MRNVLAAIGGLALLCLCGIIGLVLLAPNSGSTSSRAKTVKVQYEVLGSAKSASLTYNNAGGDTEQRSHVAIPDTLTFQMPWGEFAYVSAQNEQESGGVWCRLWFDGKLVKESKSSGGFTIATCSARVE